MEVGDKMKELNITVDEMDKLTKALKNDKFREMLSDYAQELSDPENKKRYEEEIKMLEQERGNTIEFIHPGPFKALRTSVNGKQKCFINICVNEKIGKPSCRWGVSVEGRRGQRWSLPHSLHPGREDTDPKGNKFMTYDVIFHPDTLHIAGKNKRFMDMVDSTALQGVEKAFNVTLDKNNMREMRTKYKGTPQACVIRKPIPGFKAKPSEEPDPLAFPYPDDKKTTTSSQANPAGNTSDAEPKSIQIQPQKKDPTKPNHTVKYRSFIDLQDFRCSRDSAQSPRPKEIVVTINVPLLKAVTDASLEVEERRLLLESNKPAYRLELPLAYPVDEERGQAKFDKKSGQLIVTLPVLPSNEAFDFAAGSQSSQDERQGAKSEGEEVSKGQRSKEQRGVEEEEVKEERGTEEGLKQQARGEKGEEEGERGQEKGEEQMSVLEEEEAGWKMPIPQEEELKDQKQENGKDVRELNPHKRQQDEDRRISKHDAIREDKCDCGVTDFQYDPVHRRMVSSEENTSTNSPITEKEPASITPKHSTCQVKEGEVNLNSCLEETPKMKTSDIKEETEKTPETSVEENPKLETGAAFLHHRSGESSKPADTQSQNNAKDCSVSHRTEETPVTDKADEPSKGRGVTLCSEEAATGSEKQEENIDEDDLLTEQTFQNPEEEMNEPPPALLREIDEDGNQTVISDHSTSAGFVFQNSLMFELD